MKHTPTFAALGRAARGILPWGLILALLLGAGTGLLSWRAWEANTPVSARVTLAWSGAESGLDPAGKPFDPDSFRQEEGLTAAIRDAGVDVSADRLAAFLYADPQVPADAVARVTARDSVFEGNDVPSTLALKPEAYYPTTYTLTLDVPESDYMGGRIVNPGKWDTDRGFAQVTVGADLIKDLGADNPDNNIVFAEAGNYTVTLTGAEITIVKN